MTDPLCRPSRQNCKGAALLALLLATCAAPPAALEGPARVIDGDTLEVAGEVVRIYGVDAPELAQECRVAGRPYACGQMARNALSALTGASVRCHGSARGKYGRRIAVCSSGGLDLGAVMVGTGWALAARNYSSAYVALEAEARAARRGLWAGAFMAPATWRRTQKKPPRP